MILGLAIMWVSRSNETYETTDQNLPSITPEDMTGGDYGPDEIATFQKIIKKSVHYLKDNSYLIIEHSHYQTLLIKEYAYNNNLKYIESIKDDLGFNRISIFSNIF